MKKVDLREPVPATKDKRYMDYGDSPALSQQCRWV